MDYTGTAQPGHYFRVLGNEMSLHLPSPAVFATLPSLYPAKVSSCWLLECSPVARFDGHGYKMEVCNYPSSSDYVIIEVCKYYNPI